ncbi:type I secretion system permease/ATPase [Paracraurococcus lichenis]|uniref:Type I secretion system permease/ATPase n=1 Tax=Paracraurococcus lichenis TaxID=3064888 RepID=A0ABT9ECT4_9PROT|nr:type I secretion system permease/ATPase [Paracraurococcus sp. LOR1-02]MDO9713840.1 type I secretion system permease/ATPase [Paracraurococcus sp. LOR1-02]
MSAPITSLPPTLAQGLQAVRPPFVAAIVFSFFINLLMFISPLYMLQIYDRVLASRSTTTLAGITVLAAALLLVYAALEMIRSRVLVRAGLMFDAQVAQPAFNALHRANLLRPAGGQAQGLRDVDTLREFLTGPGLIALCDAPWLPVFVAASFLLHPWFGWMAIGGSVVIIGPTLLNELATRRQLHAASNASIAALQGAQASFRNSEVLQAMGMLAALRGRWATAHAGHLRLQALASDRSGMLVAATKFFRMLLQVAILGVGAFLAIEREISPGAMIAASILIGRALQPVELAIANWRGLATARTAYGRLRTLFDLAGPEEVRMPLPAPKGHLQADGLVVAAPGGGGAILRGVALSVEPGEILAVIGPSAAGKSSLARALVGIWPALEGSVRLDGSALTDWNPQELGQHIGYLPQDIELFAGTVAENIARFSEPDGAAVVAAATAAGCHEMIQRLPQGYNTPIGEGGAALSGGQRQRLGLARALYRSPCLLVLDEPNSNLDTAGEQALIEAMQGLRTRQATMVIVTHKLNILALADKVLILDAGTVQAFGRRDVILSRLLEARSAPPSRPIPGPAAARTLQQASG